MSNAGDVNGDGFDDVMIFSFAQISVVFGKSDGYPDSIDLHELDAARTWISETE